MPHGGPPLDDRPNPDADRARRGVWFGLLLGLSLMLVRGAVVADSPLWGIFGVAMTAVGLVVPYLMLRRAFLAIREVRRLGRGVCVKCGYSLTNLASGKCPECGQTL